MLAGMWLARPEAHDIPASVTVQAFARPEGKTLRLILRVPLVSMRDFTIPTIDGVFLDLPRVDALLPDMAGTWLVTSLAILEDDREIGAPTLAAARISLPSDPSFAGYDAALAHLRGPPLAPGTRVPLAGALFDALLEYPIESDRSRFAVDPKFARFGVRVATSFRFQLPGETERAFHFLGDPGLVRMDPRWHQAARRFVWSGFEHILDGIDHLLFVFCLVLPLRRIWQLVGVVTAFTAAHSITLFCAAFGIVPGALWFPPLVETFIAASIVYMALENIVVAAIGASDAGAPATPVLRRRWLIAFAFGLVHGFGFSFALGDTLQFAGSHLILSLVSFNVGVELGQVAVLAILVPVLALAFRVVVPERIGVIVASALVTHTAWHWMVERGGTLGAYDWSVSGPAGVATLLRWLMAIVGLFGVVWLARTWRRR
jgi:hypothetical protein